MYTENKTLPSFEIDGSPTLAECFPGDTAVRFRSRVRYARYTERCCGNQPRGTAAASYFELPARCARAQEEPTMAMKSRKQYTTGPSLGSKSHYPAISQAYWAPQPQNTPYSVPGIVTLSIETSIAATRRTTRGKSSRRCASERLGTWCFNNFTVLSQSTIFSFARKGNLTVFAPKYL